MNGHVCPSSEVRRCFCRFAALGAGAVSRNEFVARIAPTALGSGFQPDRGAGPGKSPRYICWCLAEIYRKRVLQAGSGTGSPDTVLQLGQVS